MIDVIVRTAIDSASCMLQMKEMKKIGFEFAYDTDNNNNNTSNNNNNNKDSKYERYQLISNSNTSLLIKGIYLSLCLCIYLSLYLSI
jgi:hypothetical protein